MLNKLFHASSLTSTIAPDIAAAAAIAGDIRWVRPPGPCRPSKLRFEVEAHRSPGCKRSGFMHRHIEHPASRHSKPASRNSLSSPSSTEQRRVGKEVVGTFRSRWSPYI